MKLSFLNNVGPGFVIAATGLGAGDLIAATVAGVKFETALLWAVVLGALLKGALNEGLARWQLATGSTLLEGWIDKLPKWVSYYFLAYLFLWAFLVAAALMAASGLAAHTLFPQLSINTWAIIHSLAAVGLIRVGRYSLLENLMKLFIGVMFITVIIAAFKLAVDWRQVAIGFIPGIPEGSLKLLFGVIGGVGGSVTLLCYGYWMREKQWNSTTDIKAMRIDLLCAYSITALFGICIVILAANSQPEAEQGTAILIALATQLDKLLGEFYGTLFLVGFWGAVFSSLLGVWQGVPYLFEDFVKTRNAQAKSPSAEKAKSPYYWGFLAYLAVPPFLMLFFQKPVWLAVTYAVAGAFFMPFLALTLLYMNNRFNWMQQAKNGLTSNGLLICALLLFIVLFYWALPI